MYNNNYKYISLNNFEPFFSYKKFELNIKYIIYLPYIMYQLLYFSHKTTEHLSKHVSIYTKNDNKNKLDLNTSKSKVSSKNTTTHHIENNDLIGQLDKTIDYNDKDIVSLFSSM
jgi:hypothetical protein